jgi:tetratricopeptide (TPR) repeat protein
MKFLRWLRAKLSLRGGKAAPSTDHVHQLLHEAHAHLLSEEYDEARSLLLQAIELRYVMNEPETVNYVLMSLETTWMLTEKFEEGISFFSDYLGHYPSNSAAYGGRAGVLWYSGRLEEAMQDFTRSLELKPKGILSLSGRGQVLAEVGRAEEALEDLNLALQELKAIQMSSPSWMTWYAGIEAFVQNGRGFAFAALGQSERAMAEFEQSINLCPENAWVYHNRAQVYDRAGNGEQAISDYEKALAKNGPSLNPIRKKQAERRLKEILNQS